MYSRPDRLRQARVLVALVRGNSILVPLRSLFEQMGGTVSYDASTKAVDPAARRLLGVRPPEEGKAAVVFWEPPERLREPLAEVLQTQREYLPDGFSNAIVLQRGEQSHSYLPRVLPIRDQRGRRSAPRCSWKTLPASGCWTR